MAVVTTRHDARTSPDIRAETLDVAYSIEDYNPKNICNLMPSSALLNFQQSFSLYN